MRVIRQVPFVFLLCFTVCSVAAAKDVDALADFVRPAYTAMNFAVLCAPASPHFLAKTSGPRGTAIDYAEHVKNETIEFLTQEEAVAVLRLAADAARQAAREKLYQLALPTDDAATAHAVRQWCEGEAKQFVLQFIQRHDEDHIAAIELLWRAWR
jgi:hypothetical protein